ncbi:ADP-ribosylglycohydrolase family protein [Arthrobacter halodurans]|uniref:ADP-ribosylglycohydrolase family protein n=1 Tax=Arthrobacter halodurans TaxID=516699 RepID=A0ABV4UI78_9MICC
MTSTDETPLTADEFSDRVLAVLAATAVAPTAGRAPAPDAPDGGSSLQLYLMDGLLEALEWANDGVGSDEAACMWLAGLRWYRLATGGFPPGAPEPQPRWIDRAFGALAVRGIAPADPQDLAGLAHPDMGSVGRPHLPAADGPGVLARAAVCALLPRVTRATTAKLATDAAALTHGAPDATAAAARAAILVRDALAGSDAASDADDHSGGSADGAWASLRAAVSAVTAAGELLRERPARSAERGTAAALFDAATRPLAGRPAAAAFAGALVAAAHGTAALPEDWEARTASAGVMREMTRRWRRVTFG